ncbi:MAG: hypothetical protein LBK23_01565 [Oscillospiraceae bacterium]|jgi:flagellin|nr:hypothetical protein [Oscillospiraceae bacterium]
MRIQNNVPALNAHRYYGINQAGVTKSIAKLSSGYRINSAADDAAGLAISEKMRAQIRGLTMASKNTQDAISLIQTAEGGMQEIDNMLQRIRELVVYASNDTQEQNAMGTSDRQKIQDEISQLAKEIDSMKERVEFNKKTLLNGSQEAVPASGALAANLDTTTTALLAAKENYLIQETKVETSKEALQKARDTFSNILWDTEVNDALKELSTSTAFGATAAAALSYIESIGKASVLESVTTTSGLLATSTLGALVSALQAQASAINAATATATEAEKVNAAKIVAALGVNYGGGSLGSAITAWSTSITNVTNATTLLTNYRTQLGSAETAKIAAQAAYDAAPKTTALYFQVGANSSQGIEVSIGSMDTKKLGIGLGDGSGTTISVLNVSGRQHQPATRQA